MSYIERLPHEIFAQIVSAAHDDARHPTDTLTKISRVCKTWNFVGNRILWKSVHLTDNNIFRFVGSPLSQNYALVKTLSISTSTLRFTQEIRCSGTQKPGISLSPRALHGLTAHIEEMQCLSTFSLYDIHGKHRNCVCQSSYSSVGQLLRTLPRSIKSLEVDIEMCEDCHHEFESHCCLSSMINRYNSGLESLRLHLPVVCPILFKAADTIRSIFINMSWMDMYGGCACKEIEHKLWCYDTISDAKQVGRTPDHRSKILAIARRWLRQSKDKSLQAGHFVLLSTYTADEDCGPSHVLLKDDVVSQQSTAYPIWCINDDEHPDEELWALRVSNSDVVDDRDLIGTITNLEKYIENAPATHPDRQRDEDTPDSPTQLYQSQMMKKYSLMKHSEIEALRPSRNFWQGCDLWEHEKRADSRCLVEPQVMSLGKRAKLDMRAYGDCGDQQAQTVDDAVSGCHELDEDDVELDPVTAADVCLENRHVFQEG